MCSDLFYLVLNMALIFMSTISPTTLLITNSTSLHINHTLFPSPPSPCRWGLSLGLISTTMLNCSQLQLDSLGILDSPKLPSNLLQLNFSYNRLTSFSPNFLHEQLRQLEILDIRGNEIFRIVDGDVTGSWNSLKSLNLGSNGLRRLEKTNFIFAVKLNTLILSRNELSSIEMGSFGNLHDLYTLDLSHNRFTVLENEWFWGLWNLRRLLLNNNNMHRLSTKVFSHLPFLQQLDLSNNRLRKMEKLALHGLYKTLEGLNLADNLLEFVPIDELQACANLKVLDLSGTMLQILSSNTNEGFFDLQNLTLLQLNNLKHLRLIDAGAFEHLPNLKTLELNENNDLKFFSSKAFISLPNLSCLRLRNSYKLQIAPLTEWLIAAPKLLNVDLTNCTALLCQCAALSSAAAFHDTVNVSRLHDANCINKDNLHVSLIQAATEGGCTNATYIIPAFSSIVYVREADSVRLPCRVYPEHDEAALQLQWQYPSSLASDVKHRHVNASNNGDLWLKDAVIQLAGRYVCRIKSTTMSTMILNEVSVDVKINELEARISASRVEMTSFTVTWEKLWNPEKYLILYKELEGGNYNQVAIKPYMHSFLISGLTANTKYEVCIGLMQAVKFEHLHCITVTTKNVVNMENDVFRSGRIVVILISIVGICLGVFVVCLICCSSSRECKHDQSDTWSETSLADEGGALSDSTPMTFENRALEDYDNEEDDEDDDDDYDNEEDDEELQTCDFKRNFFHPRSVQSHYNQMVTQETDAVQCTCRQPTGALSTQNNTVALVNSKAELAFLNVSLTDNSINMDSQM